MDRRVASVLAVAALFVASGLLAAGSWSEVSGPTGDDRDRACVTFLDGETDAVDGHVETLVADTRAERYQGLSGTDDLPNGTGMLFVFDAEAERTFVMREMNYPIDMVFVGGDRRVTRVFHAPVEHDDALERYRAPAKWVVEVPLGWTTRHGVGPGDRARIEYGCGNASLESRNV